MQAAPSSSPAPHCPCQRGHPSTGSHQLLLPHPSPNSSNLWQTAASVVSLFTRDLAVLFPTVLYCWQLLCRQGKWGESTPSLTQPRDVDREEQCAWLFQTISHKEFSSKLFLLFCAYMVTYLSNVISAKSFPPTPSLCRSPEWWITTLLQHHHGPSHCSIHPTFLSQIPFSSPEHTDIKSHDKALL